MSGNILQMNLLEKRFSLCVFAFLLFILGITADVFAQSNKKPILVISSYNPETSSTAANIQEFQTTCDSLGITNPIVIVNMNCRNFVESKLWKSRFYNILSKYYNAKGELDLAAMILLGQESWSSYLSQDVEIVKNIPVVVGMISSNGLILPNELEDLTTWAPDPLYLSDLYKRNNILSGIAYKYDVSENIKMAKQLYPKLKKMALLTDNTFGGVALQAHVIAEMAKQKELELILIDGRKKNIEEVLSQISLLEENTALFLGTWRVDKNERYFLSSALYTMMLANKDLPVFTLTTLGLGEWAIGGVMPDYRNQGKALALKLNEILKSEYLNGCWFDFIPNTKTADIKKIRELNLNNRVGSDWNFINDNKSLLDKYPNLIYAVITVLSILAVAFIIVSFFLFKTRRLNLSLSVSENNNKMILNNIGVGLFFINLDFEIMWENCSVIEGMESWSFVKVGKKCYHQKLCADVPCADCPVVKYSVGNFVSSHEEVIERRENCVFSLLYTPILNQMNEYQGCVVRIEDVTLREKTNLELQEAKEAAENADKLKSLFLANMSHEIRTPLNAIVGFSELLADTDDPLEKREFIKIIEANNKQLVQLINDILDLSKIEAGTLEFHLEQVNVVQVIDEVYQIFLNHCNDKGIELMKDVPCAEFYILSDRNRIAQVVSNFMTNALKFTTHGSIKLGFTEREDDIKIYVQDTGIGISEAKRKSIFERFVKLNSFAQGTGLGLSICMMIVNRLNGQINVDSKEENGSTFWFTIPK